ncbi:hypothetical protein OB955_09635 [Halobacteria archaeon AArc-m2/3/4]|uniref:Uncharacterized protein n=1 Tax=Natronoglomus mannanivorans TaxID=2979990 RepID=A0ABT2QDJ5_9EURY|nr:hypothetical protein [Halobacteria archaeon AArc-m2/3/4]
MKHQFWRAYSIYQQNGPIDLYRAIKRFIVSGSLRDEVLNLLPKTELCLRYYIRLGHTVYPSRFTDADPFKILWIDPDEIIYDVSDSDIPIRFGKVYNGDWDQTESRFTDRTVYRTMKRHFINGESWENTDYYEQKRKQLEAGKSVRGCASVEDLPDYFARFDKLYESLREEGYKSQRTLIREAPNETIRQNLDAPIPALNEIGLCIGRDGSLLRGYRGEHRLAIAKLADVDSVAVQILVRHRGWQSIRNKIRNEESITEVSDDAQKSLGHPDIDNHL